MPDSEEPSPPNPPQTQPLSRLDALRGLHVSIWEGVWATIHGTLTGGAFQTGFALMIGASPFGLGLLAGLSAVVGLVQLPAALYSERRGERRRFVAGVSLPGRVLWGLILLIPFTLPRALQFPVFLLLATLSSALLNAGNPAWTSWMSDLVPAASRGQYFARRNTLMGLVTMLVPLPAGAFLDQAVKLHRFEPRLGFAVLFGGGCAAAFGSLVLMLRQPEPPARRQTGAVSPLRSLAAPLADRNFFCFLVYSSAILLGQTIAGQFFTAWQIDHHALGLSYLTVQFLGAVAAAAGLLSTPLWGYLGDKYGSRPVLALSTAGAIIPPLIWLFTIPSPHALWLNIALIVLLNIISGAVWAAVGLAQFNLLLAIAPPEGRSTYTAVFAAVTGVSGGISPILGGALMVLLAPVAFRFGPIFFNNYKLLFLSASVIRLGCLLLIARVTEREGHGTRYFIEQLASARAVSSYRSLRRLSQPVAEEERREAVERLGDIRTPLAVEELTGALDDVSPAVRESAAQALGAIADVRALPALIAKLSDPAAGIGELAADALGRIGAPDAADALASASVGPDAGVRVAALRALSHIPDAARNPHVADAALISLDPSHPTVCEAACALLAEFGDGMPLPTARIALPLLLRLLEGETARGMRLAAARALERMAPLVAREPGVWETVRARLDAETDPAVLAQEAATLGEIGRISGRNTQAILDALLPVLRHPSVAGLAYKQVLEAIADIGLSPPGSFYPYLGMMEMARDQTFSRLIAELTRRLRNGGEHAESIAARPQAALDAYSRGDYGACLAILASAADESGDGTPAAIVLRSLSQGIWTNAVRAEVALLAALLLREHLA